MPEGGVVMGGPGMPDISGEVVMGGALPVGGAMSAGAIPPDAMPGVVSMGGAIQIEGLPSGAVQIEAMPNMQAGPSSCYFEEYRFVKPIKYSGYRFVMPEFATEDHFPKDWRIIVDCVDY